MDFDNIDGVSPDILDKHWTLKLFQLLAIPVNNTIEFFEMNEWTQRNRFENDSIEEVRFFSSELFPNVSFWGYEFHQLLP
jgi:hypothetical protein